MAVKCGSSSVTIYRNESKKGYCSFVVRYFLGSQEVRLTRANFEAAHKEAESAARSLANGEMDVLTLRSDDRLSYVRSIENLRPTGVDLETATKDYRQFVTETQARECFAIMPPKQAENIVPLQIAANG